MAMIKTAYPEYYRQNSEIDDAINLWGRHFKDDEFKQTAKAIDLFIESDEKGYPPKIGQVKAMIRTIRKQEREDANMLEQQKQLNKPVRVVTKEDMDKIDDVMDRMRTALRIPKGD